MIEEDEYDENEVIFTSSSLRNLTVDDFFPYVSYRPGQQEMLETAFDAVLKHEILMIDAPTGSGKSSLIASLLAAAKGKKIIIAVRSNAQLSIYQHELSRIREKKYPNLKFSYIYGKSKLCPYLGKKVYDKCNFLKRATNRFFLKMYDTYSPDINPLNTPEYQDLIQSKHGMSHLCPYYACYLQSVHASKLGRQEPVDSASNKIITLVSLVVAPEKVVEFADIYCPYTLLWESLKLSDVIILNYHYLLRRDVKKILCDEIYHDDSKVVLLLDEAHNIGDIVKGINKCTFSERTLARAEKEYVWYVRNFGMTTGCRECSQVLNGFHQLFAAYHNRDNLDVQWELRPLEFFSKVLGENYTDDRVNELISNFEILVYTISEIKMKEQFPLRTLLAVIMRLQEITWKSPYFVCIEKINAITDGDNEEAEEVDADILTRFPMTKNRLNFEILCLDPGIFIRNIILPFSSAVMASGTLSPVNVFREYYFGLDLPVRTYTVPNAFPKENRLILATSDLTSMTKYREEMRNMVIGYVQRFITIPGNVAVFFTSYAEMDWFVKSIEDELPLNKHLYVESRDPNYAAKQISEFMQLPDMGECGVLFGVCGAKWFEGIDFKGDALKAAFVVGYPLGVLNRYQMKMNSWFSAKFCDEDKGLFIAYYLPALNKTVQALGRVLRNADEKGILVLGDYRYINKKILRSSLPDWMRKEMRICTVSSFDTEISQFEF